MPRSKAKPGPDKQALEHESNEKHSGKQLHVRSSGDTSLPSRVSPKEGRSNKENIRRSGRSTKGVGGALEQLQMVAAAVDPPPVRQKRTKQVVNDVPESTRTNPMAPEKVRPRKRVPPNREVLQGNQPLGSVPRPVQEYTHIVPPGTEPILRQHNHQFGFRQPPAKVPDVALPNRAVVDPRLLPHAVSDRNIKKPGPLLQKRKVDQRHSGTTTEDDDTDSDDDNMRKRARNEDTHHRVDSYNSLYNDQARNNVYQAHGTHDDVYNVHDNTHDNVYYAHDNAQDDVYSDHDYTHDYDSNTHKNVSNTHGDNVDNEFRFHDDDQYTDGHDNNDPLLEPGFDQSPSEDEREAEEALRAPQTDPRAAMLRNAKSTANNEDRPSANANMEDDSYDVVASHWQRNGVPKPPDQARLQSDERRSTLPETRTESVEDVLVEEPLKSSFKPATSNPKRLGFYPSNWKHVLGGARFKSRLWMTLECAFPIRSNKAHRTKMASCLTEALVEYQEEGNRVEDGYYPKHKEAMIDYLFADRSTFRAELKKKARSVVDRHYKIEPEEVIPNQNAYHAKVAENVQKLLATGNFLHGAKDGEGRTNNFMHNAIADLCQSFFYGSSKLASHFPEVFKDAVPIGAVALAATAIKACLCAYQAGFWDDSHEFTADNYSKSYNKLLLLIDKMKIDAYHWAKFCAAREIWASTARLRTGEDAEDDSLDMQLVLD